MNYFPSAALCVAHTSMNAAAISLSAADGVVLTFSNEPLVTDIPSKKYRVIRPIPVQVEMDEYDDVIVTFRDAGISMSGETQSEAIQGLAGQIAASFARYKQAAALGPWAKKQLQVLERYVGDRVKSA